MTPPEQLMAARDLLVNSTKWQHELCLMTSVRTAGLLFQAQDVVSNCKTSLTASQMPHHVVQHQLLTAGMYAFLKQDTHAQQGPKTCPSITMI